MDHSELFHDTYQEIWQIEQDTEAHNNFDVKNDIELSKNRNESPLNSNDHSDINSIGKNTEQEKNSSFM